MSNELRAIAPGAEGHFQLWFYAAVLRLIVQLDTSAAHFPFLEGYAAGLQRYGVSPDAPAAGRAWETQIADWEQRNASSSKRLPLLALRQHASLSSVALTLLMCAGLPEEDARFGDVFAALNGDPTHRRPTVGLLSAWWDDGTGEVRAALRTLLATGLLHVPNAEAPRSEWILHPPALLWECLQGEPPARPAPWASFCPPEQLPDIANIILDAQLARELASVPELLASGALPALIVRGPQHNGRRTVVGALARAAGYGLLLLEGLGSSTD
ncbi:MAG: hypothetical protein H7Z42_05525, partial [Roseiflexaceae bacterium]|nr:hypothetical protein [Roseiflexaceae bacterium]